MSWSGAVPRGAIETVELETVLQSGLRQRGSDGVIARIERRPSPYASSFALEELDVELRDGSRLALMLKNLSRQAMNEDALRVKPDFLYDPQREIAVYRDIVEPQGLGASLHAFHIDPMSDGCWLAIERITGHELYQVGELEVWSHVAGWLGGMHGRLARLDHDQLRASARLVTYDARFYDEWLSRAAGALRGADAGTSSGSAFGYVRDRYPRVIDRLLSLPVTIVHGEFYASNVLTAGSGETLRVCPVDWEMTAVAPGLIDLAALTLGQWTDAERRGFLVAYFEALPSDLRSMSVDDVAEAVDYCQIHLAVQWLGWFGTRPPHPTHARDWLSEAVHRVERLRL